MCMTPQQLMQRARDWYYRKHQPFPATENEKLFAQFYDPHYWGSNYEMKMRERAIWANPPDDLKQLTFNMVKTAKRMHFPFYIHTNWRSPELQMKLYLEGNSQVTDGAHQRSAAIDVVHPHDHWQAPPDYWKALGILAKYTAQRLNIKIQWGGDWSGLYDPAHIELKNWRQVEPVTLKPIDEEFLYWSPHAKH